MVESARTETFCACNLAALVRLAVIRDTLLEDFGNDVCPRIRIDPRAIPRSILMLYCMVLYGRCVGI
jgi:hypothetical protein